MKSYDQFYWMKFSRLTITSFSHQTKSSAMMHVICDCWIKKVVRLSSLKSWSVLSCWCLAKESLQKRNMVHWMYYTKFYKVYDSIQQRCYNKNNKDYHLYWWKWIICEWENFDEFKEDMYSWYKEWLSIDRMNWNGNYCKSNCQWIELWRQQRNKCNNHYITYQWQTKCIAEWVEILWINKHRVLKLENK